jgi:simple sugar transport system permease protein
MHWRGPAETITITAAALILSLAIFGVFMAIFAHVSPIDLFHWMYIGAFGTSSSWSNTLTKAAPLILTALCTALPARLGLIVIGGEGALVLGGLGSVCVGLMLKSASPIVIQAGMMLTGIVVGGLFIALVGILRDRRGVNETISSLLLTYVAIGVFNFLVENPHLLRDPASLNKPSTFPIPTDAMLGNMFGMNVHWGLGFGIIFCVITWLLMSYTTFGFAVRMVGGNVRAAQGAGLPVGWLILVTCMLGGGAAGLAGAVEIAAVNGQANASLYAAGYGFTGILVSFIARHNPLAIIPAAILFGGLNASSGVMQRKLRVPDASVGVLMGIIFVMVLLFETLYGRIKLFQTPQHIPVTPSLPEPKIQVAPQAEVVAQ